MEDLIPITRHQVPSGECCLKQTLQPLLGCYDTDLLPRQDRSTSPQRDSQHRSGAQRLGRVLRDQQTLPVAVTAN